MRSSNSSTLLSFVILSSFANLFRGNRAFELPKRAPLRLQTGSEANVLHRPVAAAAGAALKSGDRLSPRGRLHEVNFSEPNGCSVITELRGYCFVDPEEAQYQSCGTGTEGWRSRGGA